LKTLLTGAVAAAAAASSAMILMTGDRTAPPDLDERVDDGLARNVAELRRLAEQGVDPTTRQAGPPRIAKRRVGSDEPELA
jgi:hypothetical protein